MRRAATLLLVSSLAACGCRRAPDRSLTIIGTGDLHGHLEGDGGQGGVALLGGYLRILRRTHNVVLVDAGDLFQGTLESNLTEGAPVVRAMNALGYDAAALGNHEFDYGPVGMAPVARAPGEDPRGALKARAREARFPFLAANVIDQETGRAIDWDHFRTAVQISVGGVAVGLTGGPTRNTPTTTNALNLRGLRFDRLDGPIREQALELRRQGAQVVVAVVHAGSRCRSYQKPDDLSSCETDTELFELARALPAGLVDVIVGGHTHAAVAHRWGSCAIIEAWSKGKGFGRVDLVIDGRTQRVKSSTIWPPHAMAAGEIYEGSRVEPDPSVAATFAEDRARVAALRARSLGVLVSERLWPSYEVESPLGNLIADLERAAVPGADFAIYNGGGLRAELPAGPLTYGALYEVLPFDNLLAVMTLRGATLRALLASNYGGGGHGFLSISGLKARCHCEGGQVRLELTGTDGARLDDARSYRLVTSDFLANGGDGFQRALADPATKVEILWQRPPLHDLVAESLEHRGGTLRPSDYLDRAHPRAQLPGPRPICRKTE